MEIPRPTVRLAATQQGRSTAWQICYLYNYLGVVFSLSWSHTVGEPQDIVISDDTEECMCVRRNNGGRT